MANTLRISWEGLDQFKQNLNYDRTVRPVLGQFIRDAGVILLDEATEVTGRKQFGYVPVVTGNLRNSARLAYDPGLTPFWAEVQFTASYAHRIDQEARTVGTAGYQYIAGAIDRAEPLLERLADKAANDLASRLAK